MRRGLATATLVGLLSLLLFSLPAHRSAAQSARPEDEPVNLVREWLRAESASDWASLERLVADDFIGTSFGGDIVTKADIVPREGSGGRGWPKMTLRETTVRLYGATGVVMGRVAVEDAAHPGEFALTMVFIKRERGWQMVAAHLSRPPREP